MEHRRNKLLCIDDHEVSLAGWCLYLQNAGYSVETARSAQEGLEVFATRPVDLVLLDYAMPEMNGGEVAAAMKRIKPDVRIVLFSGVSVPNRLRDHIDAFIVKGQPPAVVLNEIKRLLDGPAAATS